MTYALTLSPCAQYVVYRPSLVTESLEEAQQRSIAVMTFARQHGTRLLLLDWRSHDIPLSNRFSDALFKLRGSLPRGAYRVALLYSLDAQSYSRELIGGYTDILNALGQSAAQFADHDQAVGWLLAEERLQANG